MYRVSAYFCARSLADVPLDLFTPCIFMPIVYWMGGLRATAEAFLSHAASIMLLVLVGSSLGLLIGACVSQVKRAQTVRLVDGRYPWRPAVH
jgi:ABC-type Na+ efflux pump permease subunit